MPRPVDSPVRTMHDLTHFSLADMLEVGSHVRACCNGAESLQAVAQRIVSYLYRDLRDARGARATAMVRFFLTRPFGALPLPYQEREDRKSTRLNSSHGYISYAVFCLKKKKKKKTKSN